MESFHSGGISHFQGRLGPVPSRERQVITLCLLTLLVLLINLIASKGGGFELQFKSLTPFCLLGLPASGMCLVGLLSQVWTRTAMGAGSSLWDTSSSVQLNAICPARDGSAWSHPFLSALACPPLPSYPRRIKNVVFLKPHFTAILFYTAPPKYLE